MTEERQLGTIEKVTRLGALFDFYGELLTARQREMVELHYFDDWSLGEIAEHFGISRQAVHDNLRRATEQLEAYETTLQLVSHYASRKATLAQLEMAWKAASPHVPQNHRETIEQLLMTLLSEA